VEETNVERVEIGLSASRRGVFAGESSAAAKGDVFTLG
jgi:hypothetical protein